MSSRIAPKNNNTAVTRRSGALSVARSIRPPLRAFSRNAAAAARNRILAANIERLKKEQKGLRRLIADNAAAKARVIKMTKQLNRSRTALSRLSPSSKLLHNYFKPDFNRLGISNRVPAATTRLHKSPERSPNRECKGWFCGWGTRKRRSN